jgi:hypothetical protein
MKTKQFLTLMAMSVLAMGSLQLPARADDGKAALVQIIRQEDGPLHAMVVEKLVSLNLSPEWWQYLLQRDNKSYHTISNIADSLLEAGKMLGCGDAAALDQSGDATSPLVADAVAKLQSNVSCSIQLTDTVKEDVRPKVIENVAMFEAPMTNAYYCKPRGHKLHVFITLDAKAQAMRFQVSKDGNDYHFAIPAYIDLMTSPIQEAFKQGT